MKQWEDWIDNSDTEVVFELRCREEGSVHKYTVYFEGGYSDERHAVYEYGNKAKEL